MSWGRIDDKLWCHPKFEAAGIEASGAWLWLYAYSCFVERPNLPKVVALKRVDQNQRLLDKLVEVGLLEETEGEYLIHDWEDYRPKDKRKKTPEEISEQARKNVSKRWEKQKHTADTTRTIRTESVEAPYQPVESVIFQN